MVFSLTLRQSAPPEQSGYRGGAQPPRTHESGSAYTILNSAPPIFKKIVDKTFAKPGDVLTYTVTGINPNNYPLPGVVFTDPTPAGTTYLGNLVVSVPYECNIIGLNQ